MNVLPRSPLSRGRRREYAIRYLQISTLKRRSYLITGPKQKKRGSIMNYHFKIHKEGKGFWAQCIEFEGCITQADDLKSLKNNMQEALNLYIEEYDGVY